MIYLLATIGLVTLVVLVWRAFGPELGGGRSARTQVPPDDDPEFLRRLDEQRRNQPDSGKPNNGDPNNGNPNSGNPGDGTGS